jgi:hypothetical protein
MVVIQDFTKLSEGVTVPTEGQVARCPRCGRNGIERRPEAGSTIVFLHVQTSRLFGDGMLTEPEDCCSMPDTSLNPTGLEAEH